MAKIKLTKNELKKQKDALKMYKRYLPTLQLKKQQLQMEIRHIEAKADEVQRTRDELYRALAAWIAVFGEIQELRRDDGSWLIAPKRVITDMGNIAGVAIPVFVDAEFAVEDYDLFVKPLWIDAAIEQLKRILLLDIEIAVLKEQIEKLSQELRITSQRVNLFEKVKIPETTENIRKIRIYLGDQQTAQVVRGKIAKRKVVERTQS